MRQREPSSQLVAGIGPFGLLLLCAAVFFPAACAGESPKGEKKEMPKEAANTALGSAAQIRLDEPTVSVRLPVTTAIGVAIRGGSPHGQFHSATLRLHVLPLQWGRDARLGNPAALARRVSAKSRRGPEPSPREDCGICKLTTIPSVGLYSRNRGMLVSSLSTAIAAPGG